MSAMLNSYAAGAAFALIVGSSSIDTGKGGSIEADGFAISDATFGSFGSISPSAWSGFPIVSLYAVSGGNPTFVVTGDAHLLSPVVIVNGVNLGLGAGSYSGGQTTFGGGVVDPFTPFGATLPVSIS